MQGMSANDLAYVIRLDEIVWGGLLLALTIAVHGIGMFPILRVAIALMNRAKRAGREFLALRLGVLIVAVWMIVLVHLAEIAIWAEFFV